MTNVERFRKILNFEKADRLPVIEWAGWWNLTIERWRKEGIPDDVPNQDIQTWLGLDELRQLWFTYRSAECPRAKSHGAPVIESEEDYDKIRPLLYPEGEIPAREKTFFERLAEKHEKGDTALWYTFDGFFWFPRALFGIENHFYSFYDYPELYHRICNDAADYMLRRIEDIYSVCTPEFMTFAEDMSYNNGPMLSEECFDEFLLPYYQRVIPEIKKHGTKVFVDTDGDVTKMIPWLRRAGIEGVLPLERQAGVDLNLLRKDYPDFLFIGGFDKMTMPQGEQTMRAEFERLLPVMRSGGYVPGVDHQTPPGCSLENYYIYLRLLREYAAASQL